MNVRKLTLCELKDKFMKGEVSAVEIVKAYFQRVLLVESKVKAFITTAKKDTLVKEADELDFTLSKWRKTMPLMAMPIAVKDNICTKGVKTTCGSRMLENFVPPYDATVVARMKEHGYYLIGKTNMDEFAMGSSTETSAFGPTRNPCNLAAIPGGSSGGSAAAVAAELCVAALGSDTGGSIRQPAACCGVVGLKPTYGRVSRYGLVAFASSLDQIGPITKDVRDAAMMMQVIAGHDPLDSTSADVPVPDYMKALKENLRGMKVGVPLEFFAEGLDPEVELAVRTAIIQRQAVRTLIKRDFDEAFKEVDVIVTPTMPTPAFKLGEKIQDPLQMYLSDIYTISVNLAGLPAISLPCGLSTGKLPIGLQIIGRPFEEEKVLRAAYAYEQATEWHLKRPGL